MNDSIGQSAQSVHNKILTGWIIVTSVMPMLVLGDVFSPNWAISLYLKHTAAASV